MTSPAGVADGVRTPRRAGLLTVPVVALVAVLLGPAGSLPAARRADSGAARPAAGALASGAAAAATRPDAASAPAAAAISPPPVGPAGLAVADTAPPAVTPAADATGVAAAGARSGTSAAAVEPADPGRPRETWAVMIGINRYPRGDHDLRTAAADARDVDDALAGYGVAPDHRLLLLDREATAANIRGALGWLTARAAPQDTAVVFFAGHAAHVGGARRNAGPEVALIAADDRPLPQSQLAGLLAPLRARSAWLAMAACYGAEFDGLLAPGRLLTAAAGRGQLAYENDDLPHSYLVEYMVQRAMIEGDAARSVEDSFQWARAQIAQHYPGREPTMIDDRAAPLVLGMAPGRPAPAASGAPGSSTGRAPTPGPGPATPPPGSDPGSPGEDGCTHVGDAVRLCGR
jgi:hypothetical protein